jgi:uncharacterized RDD family membrane protein YckC
MVSLAYRTLTIAAASATPGMRLMAIEFRNLRGERFDLTTAFIHTVLFTLSISFGLPQVISVILMLVTGRKQGLTDHFLGTAVINRTALR